jgi:sugar phosphate isomerase/epimerase
VQAGVKPFDTAYPLLKPYIGYFHIKDAIMGQGKVVPAGQGDGQIPELMGAAKEAGYDGFLSLEPHLKVAGHSTGYTGPELFATAVNALRSILNDLGIPEQ